jgi:hypothetical protein
MKLKSKTSRTSDRIGDRYGMIEPLESRIAPAAIVLTNTLPASPSFKTLTVGGGSLVLNAGDVLTTGNSGGGAYLLYVEAGQVIVHTTDLNGNGQFDFNEITGLSLGNGARVVSFVDIHGDIVTDLSPGRVTTPGVPPSATLDDSGKGDVILDNNIAEIDLRSLSAADFPTATDPTASVNAHLAMSSYSIFGNIYAGGGLGLANDPTSGLHINNSGNALQAAKYAGVSGTDYYQASLPVVGSIYVGSSASGQYFTFGNSGNTGAVPDIHGNLLTFNPRPGEAGAGIYNINANAGTAFSIGTIHAGDGGFNGAGGSIVNVALQGDTAGVYKLIAGNAGSGTTGQNGGNIINFSETGAIISQVILQSGNGGTGLTGAGGNGGVINYNPSVTTAINAHFVITYGAGGDGYSKGGTGGGTVAAKLITPEGKLTTAIDLVSTMRSIGSIGTTQSFDFTGGVASGPYAQDAGFSDAVFSTTNPDQVVVALGNSSGGDFGLDSGNYIFLNSPAKVESIVVGDFNGDGHPDIAIASGSGSFAGIEVFLSQYNPSTHAFTGFSDPLFTPLPSLVTASGQGLLYSSATVTKLVAGDFTGNGVMGLAVLAQETESVTLKIDSVLIFLNGETDPLHPHGTGYFYGNFSNGNQPFIDLGTKLNPTNSIFKATALQTFNPGSGHDVVVEADLASKTFSVIDDSTGTPESLSTVSFGKVDTTQPQTAGSKPAYVDFTVLSFTITQDQINPSIADIVALSQAPADFLDAFTGDGTGNFTLTSGNGTPLAGIFFGKETPFTDPGPVALVTVPNPTTGLLSNVAILDYPGNTTEEISIYVLHIAPDMQTSDSSVDGTQEWFFPNPVNGRSSSTVVFDTYVPHPVATNAISGSGPTNFGFITANPLTTYPDAQGFAISQPKANGGFSEITAPFKTAGYFITGGNGGTSLSGAGGAGGSFGGSPLTVTGSGSSIAAVGAFSVQLPVDKTYQGEFLLIAGAGGNGFTNGGAGGGISGVSVTYDGTILTGFAELIAGNGGESLTGTGGNGGSMSQMFIQSGEYFQAGNGGIGVVGGDGGSLLGNTEPGLLTASTSNQDTYITLIAGDGATGITGGGNGGSISSFVNDFVPLLEGVGGNLEYFSGNAGNAVAGQAGTGGSILNSSPTSADNNLVGDIAIVTGSGGSGLRAGNGGAIDNFANSSTIKDIPTSFTVISGSGGHATIGPGGAGGNISNVSVSAAGIGDFLSTAVSYNRMVAGQGGASAGGAGGTGGSVTSINTSSVAATAGNVVAAGAGGDGLIAGGKGGSVNFASVDAGSAQGAKVLIIAGDGGSSYSLKVAGTGISSPQQIAMGIGGVDGPGGNGGSINNFTQSLSTFTNVDLIAGNGGATINHSVAAGNATADNSGTGGSITNVSITGNIGNSDPNVAIVSYNNIFTGVTTNGVITGPTMQDFVDNYILGRPDLALNDSVGNVGLVAGAAGRVEGTAIDPITNLPVPAPGTLTPSSNGINGYVTNIRAQSIMSMIAGNVEQVDLIQSLTNYAVTVNGGNYGANKIASSIPGFVGVLNQLNYISADGLLTDTPLPGGGALLDGAILAKNNRVPQGIRDFPGTQ